MDKEELNKKIEELAKDYDKLDRGDFEGCILALETQSGEHYQTIFNKVAEKVIMEKIDNFNQVTITNPCYNAEWSRQAFVELIKRLEGEFDCDIDYVDYSITFRYV